jgi:hypothetical protein
MAEFYYAKGMSTSICRKWCRFIFGDFLKDVEIDKPNLRFIIMLYEKILDENKKELILEEETMLQEFKEYWNIDTDGSWILQKVKLETL